MEHILRVICKKRKLIAGENADGTAMYRRLVEACTEEITDELEYDVDAMEGQKETFLGYLPTVTPVATATNTAIDVDV